MKDNKKSKKKTALIISLSLLLIAGAVAGTTAILLSSKNKNNSVPFSDGIKFNNIDIQTLRDSFQDKINKNKYTIEQFSVNLKNDVANILGSILNNNDANILVKEVVYNNNEIVITLNSEYEYTLLEKRDDVVLKTVQDINNENNKITTLTILDLNLKFFDNYTITNTLNLFNKLQEYISNNKDTIDEFNQKLLANNTTLVDLIKNNLYVDNGTNTQPIDQNKIQNIQIVDNKIEITLESIDYLLYSISGNNNSSNISVKDNKIMISNLIFYKAIIIDDTNLNALQNNIQNLINTNQYTLNDFKNQLSSLSFKNQISNYLNIASSEINTISFESGILKITPNDNLKFVSDTNNNLIIDYNIEITNLVFYNSIMLTKLSNLHNTLNNYIAQQKLTIDAFANQANSNNTDILNLIKMNLYVLNNDTEQLIDENKILGFEFINNQFEIELEKTSLKYETNSVDSSIVVQNNKIIISNLEYFQVIAIDVNNLNNLKQNIQDLILNSKWTKDEFINKLTEDEFKTKISEFLNISVNSIDNITYNNDTLKITSNSMFEFTCNEPNTLIVDNNIILDNFTFYTAYELNNLENLYNAVNNYIALNNNKFTETEFINNVSTSPDSIKKVIADNLKVTNSSGTQKIDISNIEDVQYLNNQLEVILTTNQFKYQLTPTEHVELTDNKLIIKSLNFFQLINVSLDELNNLRSKIIDFINSKKVTWLNVDFYLSLGIFNLIKDVNTVDNHKLSEFVDTPTYGSNIIDIPLKQDIGLYKFNIKDNSNIDVSNNNIALNNIQLNMPNLPATPTRYFTWDGTKITGLTNDGEQQEYIVLPAKTTELEINVFKDNKRVKLVDMSRTKITSMPICGGSYGGDTLFYNSSVEWVILPNNLIDMGQRIFYFAKNLKEVIIPDTVTNMSGELLFYYCKSLRNINIPKNVQGSLGSNMFADSGIISITVPSGITTLESNVFSSISSLKKINLTNGLTTIKDTAIYYCANLFEITLPDTITTIGEKNFYWCGNYYGNSEIKVYVTSKDVENILINVFSGTIINLNDKSKKLN